MTAVRAIYDGRVFIPKEPCSISSGSEVTLNISPVLKEDTPVDTNKPEYSILSKEDALAMTSEIINKYRPALEELAK
jgi:predicted DNA-binding antitoxin AbrB/MazE fold protein